MNKTVLAVVAIVLIVLCVGFILHAVTKGDPHRTKPKDWPSKDEGPKGPDGSAPGFGPPGAGKADDVTQ